MLIKQTEEFRNKSGVYFFPLCLFASRPRSLHLSSKSPNPFAVQPSLGSAGIRFPGKSCVVPEGGGSGVEGQTLYQGQNESLGSWEPLLRATGHVVCLEKHLTCPQRTVPGPRSIPLGSCI